MAAEDDLYQRLKSAPGKIIEDTEDEDKEVFELDKILKRRKGYRNQFNTWYPRNALRESASDLVERVERPALRNRGRQYHPAARILIPVPKIISLLILSYIRENPNRLPTDSIEALEEYFEHSPRTSTKPSTSRTQSIKQELAAIVKFINSQTIRPIRQPQITGGPSTSTTSQFFGSTSTLPGTFPDAPPGPISQALVVAPPQGDPNRYSIRFQLIKDSPQAPRSDRTKELKGKVRAIAIDYNRPRISVEQDLVESDLFNLRLRQHQQQLVDLNLREDRAQTLERDSKVEVTGNEGSATVSHDIHYKDVNLFLDLIVEHATRPTRRDILKRDLGQLLKVTTQQWYISVLSVVERRQVKENLTFWKTSMVKKFGISKTAAEDQLIQCLYSTEDYREGVPFRSYAANKIRFCRAMGITDAHSIMTFIYNGIDPTI
ncbi:hypothetical protein B0T26DRAFT_670652 [Lasiosphaeria miniovina]|uniref:Uncharacterized protein n=1 Tax=Lasiosphaeria miniovina TaxID=1954250 RepID=A0AA40EGC7_9PEZI|nr:uncharacterized protein B0T26DRAFT_670652 [Lasiosphaeria miniovina]KAK0734343.1 hypothetical protein B0T26DRAFT_670652 [Lasiosphaeria miniovina]